MEKVNFREIMLANVVKTIILKQELKQTGIYVSLLQELHQNLHNPYLEMEIFVSKRRENSQESLP